MLSSHGLSRVNPAAQAGAARRRQQSPLLHVARSMPYAPTSSPLEIALMPCLRSAFMKWFFVLIAASWSFYQAAPAW